MAKKTYQIQDVKFNNPDLPKIKVYQPIIAGLAGLVSWVSCDDAFIEQDATVSELKDKASGISFDQGDATKQGAQIDGAINGHSSVKLDVGEYMRVADAIPTGSTAKYSKVLLLKIVGGQPANQYILSNSSGGNDYLYYAPDGTVSQRIGGPDNLIQVNAVEGRWFLVVVDVDLSTSSLKAVSSLDNKVQSASIVDPTSLDSGTLYLNAANITGNGGGLAEYAEIMIFNRPIIGTDIYDTVREYISAKYAI